MKTAARVDSNQNEIVTALRKIGAVVLSIAQVKKAFDILVGFRGKLFMMEIKDGSKPKSQRKLTSGERGCKVAFESVGVKYHIITSVDEAIRTVTDG